MLQNETKQECSDLFAAVDAIVSKHRRAASSYPYARQSIGIHLVELDQALSLLMLNTGILTN